MSKEWDFGSEVDFSRVETWTRIANHHAAQFGTEGSLYIFLREIIKGLEQGLDLKEAYAAADMAVPFESMDITG